MTDKSPTTMPVWSDYFDTKEIVTINESDKFQVYRAGSNTAPAVLMLHGGGHTSLTWSLVAQLLKKHCHVIAFDFRGHGNTTTSNDKDLSATTLVQDTISVLQALNTINSKSLLVIGHSMGGAIAVRFTSSAPPALKEIIKGVLVIDVVEGTALSALEHMTTVLSNRPSSFNSINDLVSWGLRTGVVKNPTSAAISLPSQVKQKDGVFTWITPLRESSAYWTGWFTGLSEMFLSISVHKVLLLAGTDRLDTSLTRGQMQGKFQLLLMYGCGHVIQEDDPNRTSQAIMEFYTRVNGSAFTGETANASAMTALQQKLARARELVPK